MAGEVFINVSNKKESLEFHLKEQVKKMDRPVILCPGVEPVDSLKKSNVIYTKDLSYNWLYKNLGEKTIKDLIIIDSHKIKDTKTIDSLILFSKQAALKIHFFGKMNDFNSRINPFINYLVELGYDVNELDDYVIEETLDTKLDKQKYNYGNVDWQEIYKIKDTRGKRGKAKITAEDLFNTANNLHKQIKQKLINEKTK